jgi:hypothetical protein
MPPSSLVTRSKRSSNSSGRNAYLQPGVVESPFRRRRRRRRIVLLVALAVAAGLVAYDVRQGGLHLPGPFTFGAPEPEASAPGTDPTVDPAVIEAGAGTFQFASGDGPVAGIAGDLQRYRVAVEDGIGVAPDDFGSEVERILADDRSWTAGGTLRLQRVSGSDGFDFGIYLASPATSEEMCREDGLHTGGFTSCRLGDGRVVINSARWLTAVEGYGAPLAEYRAYAINHEVGHQLGYQHELCPAAGQPAPVMQQQTLGLQGCQPFGWPYRDGARYAGPAAP